MPLYHKYISCLLIFCLLNIFESCCQCWDSEIHVGGLTFSLILPEKSKHLVAPEIYYDLCHPPPPSLACPAPTSALAPCVNRQACQIWSLKHLQFPAVYSRCSLVCKCLLNSVLIISRVNMTIRVFCLVPCLSLLGQNLLGFQGRSGSSDRVLPSSALCENDFRF